MTGRISGDGLDRSAVSGRVRAIGEALGELERKLRSNHLRPGSSRRVDEALEKTNLHLPRLDTLTPGQATELDEALKEVLTLLDEDLDDASSFDLVESVQAFSSSTDSASFPTAARDSNGGLWVAWIEFASDRGDSLWVRPPSASQAQIPNSVGLGGDLLRPKFAQTSPGQDPPPYLLVSHRLDDEQEVVGITLGPEGDSLSLERVSEGFANAFNAEAVFDSRGRLHVTFQATSMGGTFHIYYRVRESDGTWSECMRVSGGAARHEAGNAWDPVICLNSHEVPHVIWNRAVGGRYSLNVSRLDDERWRTERLDIAGDGHLLHPCTIAVGDYIVIAFDRLELPVTGGSGATAYRDKTQPRTASAGFGHQSAQCRVGIIAYGPDHYGEIGASASFPLRPGVAAFPALSLDEKGNLWLAYRERRPLPFAHYVTYLTVGVLNDWDSWVPLAVIPESDGNYAESTLLAMEEGVVTIWAGEAYLDRYDAAVTQRLSRFLSGEADVESIRLESGRREHLGLPVANGILDGHHRGAGRILGARLAVPDRHGLSHPPTLIETSPSRRVPVTGAGPVAVKEVAASEPHEGTDSFPGLRLLWGDLHRHGNVSRCAVGLDLEAGDQYKLAEDVFELDFWALTEHAEGASDYSWHHLQKMANLFYRPHRHVPFVGFEWTSFDYGHMNVIYREEGGPIWSSNAQSSDTPEKLWDALEGHEALTIPHHPASLIYPTDWSRFDSDRMRLVEVFQAATGSYESSWCHRQYVDAVAHRSSVQAALLAGRRVGLIASTDHRYGVSYVGVYSEGRTRGYIFDALSRRRCFAATAKGIVPELRIGGSRMGEEVNFEAVRDGPLAFGASGITELSKVQLIRDGKVVADAKVPERASAPTFDVDIQIEADAGGQRDLSGILQLSEGAHFVDTAYIEPFMVESDATQRSWQFNLPGRRADHELAPGVCVIGVTVAGPMDTKLAVVLPSVNAHFAISDLTDEGPVVRRAEDRGITIRARLGTGALTGLGTTQLQIEGSPELLRSGSWYYTKAIQVDGESCWSSPIWLES